MRRSSAAPRTTLAPADAAVAQAAEAHVHRGGLGVAQALAAREQLLERVREQLIRRHVLAAREQLTGGDLVEDGGHLVVPGVAGAARRLRAPHGLLERAAVSAHERDLMAARSARRRP